ncbi:hypothetical protein ABT147_32870 [Streptomyces sp. NPDC001868]|uniref:hypothetical protein n=1 Tax=Streptomyces sp. NPDC001868 TaxID=3154401 RepID=UPI00332268BE
MPSGSLAWTDVADTPEAPETRRRDEDALYANGFTGTLSVEHEDPVWSGTEEKVRTGLDIAHRVLRPLVVA